MLVPLRTVPALIDQVHDQLLAAIVDGTLAPGQRLTQESVAAMLGVSRQPVSHALQVLKRRGLLIEHGKRGVMVAPVEAQRVRDLYQVREALDGMAANLAARRVQAGLIGAEERRVADQALAEGLALDAAANIGAFVAADVAFHSALHRLSGNAAIGETVRDEWPHFMRSMGVALADADMRRRVWREHAAILAAIWGGAAAHAEQLARDHTRRAGEETASSLEDKRSVA
ncbi:MAG TPA: GntR family transcriptional regulator [Hyphomicrobiaceae bacterium]|nr:GntR family transcriptional regulator [Hyphomicrobiaceae bacterium]